MAQKHTCALENLKINVVAENTGSLCVKKLPSASSFAVNTGPVGKTEEKSSVSLYLSVFSACFSKCAATVDSSA